MIVWVPYVVVSLIEAANVYIDPIVSHITVLVAKSCVIYNVLIYAILNRKLKAAILDAICCGRQSFSLVGTPSSGNNVNRNRISRILSETEVPSHVAEAQKNRLSALTLQQSSEHVLDQYSDHLSPPFVPKVKNGVAKSVEFNDGQRRDRVLGTSNKEDSEVIANGSGVVPPGINVYSEVSLRRKKVSKIKRNSDATHASNGSIVISDDIASGNALSPQGASEESTILESHDKTLSGGEFARTDSRVSTVQTPLSILPAESTVRPFQHVHHLYTSRSAKNKHSPTLSSPSQLYKKGTRPIAAHQVTKRTSPDSSTTRASSGTDQESDRSRRHSRDGSFDQRSISSTHRPKKPRPAAGNRTNTKHAPSRRKSYTSGRRGNLDLLQTSAQELLEIQNFWKRMSLCLDDIDLDEVTREVEMV